MGQNVVKNSDANVSEDVLMTLWTPIVGYGHILFLDNWYSLSNLYRKLHGIKINIIETNRSTCVYK